MLFLSVFSVRTIINGLRKGLREGQVKDGAWLLAIIGVLGNKGMLTIMFFYSLITYFLSKVLTYQTTRLGLSIYQMNRGGGKIKESEKD